MRRIEGEIQEKRTTLAAAREAERLPLEEVRGVSSFILLGPRVSAEHARHAIALVGVIIDAVVPMPVEEGKAALERQVALRLAHVPLADRAAAITGRSEHIAEGLLFRVES